MKNAGIYVLTCVVNGKAYIGMDSELPNRAIRHINEKAPNCPAIHAAIKKHGADAFTVEIIRYPNVPHQILCWFERSHIAERNTKAPNGYNLTDGGDGSFGAVRSRETRQKMSDAQRGKNNPNFGKKHTVKTLKKMSDAQRGKKYRLGKKHTHVTRQRISETKRRQHLEKRGQGKLF